MPCTYCGYAPLSSDADRCPRCREPIRRPWHYGLGPALLKVGAAAIGMALLIRILFWLLESGTLAQWLRGA